MFDVTVGLVKVRGVAEVAMCFTKYSSKLPRGNGTTIVRSCGLRFQSVCCQELGEDNIVYGPGEDDYRELGLSKGVRKGFSSFEEAEEYLIKLIELLREFKYYCIQNWPREETPILRYAVIIKSTLILA